MENRFLSELNGEELTFVWEKNYKLQEEVRSCFEDNIMSYIDDYMNILKSGLCNWSIGFCNYNVIYISDSFAFLNACEELQKTFCFLCEDGETTKYDFIIESGKQKLEQLNDAKTDEEYEEIEYQISRRIDDLYDAVLDRINKEFEYEEEDVMDYFFECWLDNYVDDGYYINDDYELFLTETKSFK